MRILANSEDHWFNTISFFIPTTIQKPLRKSFKISFSAIED